nr:MAG TPA: hypothetical protein [Caudoviricetes sp.]
MDGAISTGTAGNKGSDLPIGISGHPARTHGRRRPLCVGNPVHGAQG